MPCSLNLSAYIAVSFVSLFPLPCPHTLPETVPAASLGQDQDEDKHTSVFSNTYIITVAYSHHCSHSQHQPLTLLLPLPMKCWYKTTSLNLCTVVTTFLIPAPGSSLTFHFGAGSLDIRCTSLCDVCDVTCSFSANCPPSSSVTSSCTVLHHF